MRRFAVVIAASLLVPLGGCTITSDAQGDATFTKREVDLKVGETTTLQVAQALGPPDFILRREHNQLWFVYRYAEIKSTKVTFKVYVTLFQTEVDHEIETSLILAFDTSDKLLYSATHDDFGEHSSFLPGG